MLFQLSELKALLMSRAIITHITFFCLQMLANFITCVMASTVLLFFLKPYCLRWNESIPMHLSMIFLKHFSQILLMVGTMLIGRYALGRLGSFPGFLSSISASSTGRPCNKGRSVSPLNTACRATRTTKRIPILHEL